MITTKKKTKKKSLTARIEEVAKLVQLFVRLRDTDEQGFGHCCTCGKKVFYKEADAGHFISRKQKATIFDENNIHLQCKICNSPRGGSGEQYKHGVFIDKVYGEGTAEKIHIKSKQIKKWDDTGLFLLKETYLKKIEEEMAKKSLDNY